ncbi:MAG TPA: amino acid adenylation domain-containing protein [Verrucomicrobiae bacterium]
MSTEENTHGIAIIGMAGRFPGARNIDEFWRNLCGGVESIAFFNGIEEAFQQPQDAPNYVRARGILDEADHFDPGFFGMTPQEATITDPQQRQFLECAWEALENAGCIPEKFNGSIGVFAGMSMNTYLAYNLATSPALMAQAGNYQLILGNDKDYLPTRVSYKLNLKGPSMTVQTACSTSLSAVCVACQNLLNYDCDVAIAGAVSVSFPQRQGYFHQAGGVASADGHCRAFDASASGTVPGEGVGIVVLKRLDEALADGDRIYAVIKGFALNNDGSSKMGFTAPSIDGQAEVIATALAMAGFSADTIGYVEAHGTGTPVGDPIEIEGLTKAFRATTEKTGFCALGSVKTNIGHLDTAAGMPGLIKAALSLYHKRIPPSLHFGEPNPKINFAHSPFYVNNTLREWPEGEFPRRAGISSFGMGGTNTHLVLEEIAPKIPNVPVRPAQVLTISAKTPTALDVATANLVKYLKEHNECELADVAYTLQTGRHDFACRRVCVSSDRTAAIQALSENKNVFNRAVKRDNPAVTFMFPGQGTQQVNMTKGLYDGEPVFRQAVDTCASLLKPHLDCDLRDILFPKGTDIEAAQLKLTQTEFAQPALFTVEYALAQLWMSWGIRPSAFIGHSLGEYVAACLSGVFSLPDALMIVAKRGQMMQLLEPGKMLAVRNSASSVSSCLSEDVCLASVNSPSLCVLSGPSAHIEEVKKRLEAQQMACTLLQVSHAFHSAMTEPMLESLVKVISGVTRNAPEIPFISNVTGDWITADEAADPQYWAKHTRQTVLFGKGVHELMQVPHQVLLETGPGKVLGNLAKMQPEIHNTVTIISGLPHAVGEGSDIEAVMRTVGQLWLAGVAVEWKALHGKGNGSLISLPTYPFEHKRYCAEPSAKTLETRVAAKTVNEESTVPAENTGYHDQKLVADEEPITVKSAVRSILCELSGFSSGNVEDHATFTELGLDSLFLTQFSLAIERRLGVRVAFGQLLDKFSTIEKLAAHVESELELHLSAEECEPANSSVVSSTVKTPETVRIPLTEAQREIWFASRISPVASCSYNESCLLHLRGTLQTDRLQQAWERMTERHEALRVTIEPEGEGQVIHADVNSSFEFRDLIAMAGDRRKEELNAFLVADAGKPFDLVAGPLVRASLIRLEKDYHVFVLTLHHIICDGHSFGRLLGELGELYSAAVMGREPELDEAMQLSEFVHSQTARTSTESAQTSEGYWVQQFADGLPVMELPVDYPRPNEWTFQGAREFRSLPASLTQELRKLSAKNGCTLYQTLLAAYACLLQRLSNQEDIVIGVPVADRGLERGGTVVGHCVNFLPLRIQASLRQTFHNYLAAVHQLFVTAYEHQNCTFGTLIKKLNVARALGRMPLTSVTFNVEHWAQAPAFRDLEIGLAANRHSFTNFDLGFNIIEVNGALELDCRYNTALFSGATIQRWLEHFQTLLEGIASNPYQLACELEILAAEEREKVLVQWNHPAIPPLSVPTVHELFGQQVVATPEAIAVVQGDCFLTYHELNERGGRLATALNGLGVGPDVPVGIFAKRSLEMVIAVLAVLKAGGAYVPLDPTYPRERIAAMLGNAKVKVLLAQSSLVSLLPAHGAEVVELDRFTAEESLEAVIRPVAGPENLAYVIYTSGSTGTPKGVAMPHQALVNLIDWQRRNSKMGRGDSTLQYSSLSFDVSFQEIFCTWCSGGTLVLIENEVRRDPVALSRFLAKHQIHRLFLPFVALQQLAEAALEHEINLPCLKEINTAGEQLQVTPQIRDFFSRSTHATLCNQYGPSESHVVTAYTLHGRPEEWPALPPIGKPVANACLYVLDACRQPVPVNVVGELYIGGQCLAKGYLNNPAQTEQKFVPDIFAPGTENRLYKTGDLARWKADGNVEFLGRADNQIKIRGYRVELGEIEAVLATHPGVSESAVTVYQGETGDKRLAGYVVRNNPDVTWPELKKFLDAKLPEFMVPSAFVFLEKLPLTPSGKIDRKSLPAPDVTAAPSEQAYVAPRNETEESLVQIWSEVLGRSKIGVHDDFFELGGHSLLVTQVISRVRSAFEVELPMQIFFERPTVEAMAAEIERIVIEEISALSDEEAAVNARSAT